MGAEWIMHRSRFGATVAEPGTAFRVITRTGAPAAGSYACVARVPMPADAGGRRDGAGRLDFDGPNWTAVTGSALMFARRADPQARCFGTKYPGRKEFSWWDGTVSVDNILDSDAAIEHVRVWLEHLFPRAAGHIEIREQ